jgi:trehalose 6-phosphate phosphatase
MTFPWDDEALLRRLRRALVVVDFDGTLAPIVADRARARLPAPTRRCLAALAARTPVVVLSGRARADVARRLGGVPLHRVVGNHGAEWDEGPGPAGPRRQVARWRAALAGALAGLPGVEIEDKGLSLAVHYRRAPRPAAARRAILGAVAALAPAADVTGGKRVVNLGVRGHDKAAALRRLRRRFPARPILFVGDDENDERAFAARVPGVVSVRVGPCRATRARYLLRDRRDVDRLLDALATPD